MPIPIIDPTSSIPMLYVGVETSYQPELDETSTAATSWSHGTLPSGLFGSSSTGAISGTPFASGFFNIQFRATNASGTAKLNVPVYIDDSARTGSGGIVADIPSTDLEIHLPSNGIFISEISTVPTTRTEATLKGMPVGLYAAQNDSKLLAIGFLKGQRLQEINPTSIRVSLKNEDDQPAVNITVAGDPLRLDTAAGPRYLVKINLANAATLIANAIGDADDTGNTFVDLLMEIEWTASYATSGATQLSVTSTSQKVMLRVGREHLTNA
jgi:hypothetical protein